MTLAISHRIALTREQRYNLASGKTVDVTGVSVPVWYIRGRTTEPAKEVFCNYILHNKDQDVSIHFLTNGYEMNIPQLPKDFVMPAEITPQEWLNLELEEQEAVMEERYVPENGRYLLDIVDGGSKRLAFSRLGNVRIKGIPTTIYHTVFITDVEDFKASFVS